LRLTPQAVARTAQRPGLILATAEEWGIFCGALAVLGRLGLGWLRKGRIFIQVTMANHFAETKADFTGTLDRDCGYNRKSEVLASQYRVCHQPSQHVT